MLGNDLYKIDNKSDLSVERLHSLITFYLSLIGADALALYEFLCFSETKPGFEELNTLLRSYNISIDEFEKLCSILNEYQLVNTYKHNLDNKYVLVINSPLTRREFVNNTLFVRNYILKNSGPKYQEALSSFSSSDIDLSDYNDVSNKFTIKDFSNWDERNESYVKPSDTPIYSFDTLFDINKFLKDVSPNLLPMRFRTYDNLKELATLADLYNISYDKMRSFLPDIAKSNSNDFDLALLKYKCMSAKTGYDYVESDRYNTPCVQYLMSLQNGKEVVPYDKRIIYNLSHEYGLNPPVINVLLEHALKNCDNRLLENYLYPIAADLHRNNVKTSTEALERLVNYKNKNIKKDVLPNYDTSTNPEYNEDRLLEILSRKGKTNG